MIVDTVLKQSFGRARPDRRAVHTVNDGEGSVSTGTGSLSGQSHWRAASSWAYGRAFFANEAAVTLASSRLGERRLFCCRRILCAESPSVACKCVAVCECTVLKVGTVPPAWRERRCHRTLISMVCVLSDSVVELATFTVSAYGRSVIACCRCHSQTLSQFAFMHHHMCDALNTNPILCTARHAFGATSDVYVMRH
jgi:hypothetical protein